MTSRPVLAAHLVRCLTEIALSAVVVAVQKAGYAIVDRLTSKEDASAR